MANDLDDLEKAVSEGALGSASKQDLERFSLALAQSQAYSRFGDRQFPQICETVRLLFVARVSSEANSLATRISKIALFISVLALLAGLVQAVAAILSIHAATH
jgi:hypothetical protein